MLSVSDALSDYLLSSSTRLVSTIIPLHRRGDRRIQNDEEVWSQAQTEQGQLGDSKPGLSASEVRVIPPDPLLPALLPSLFGVLSPLVINLSPKRRLTPNIF